MRLFQECKVGLTVDYQSMYSPYQQTTEKYLHDHPNTCISTWQIHRLFLIKTLSKVGIEGNLLNLIKDTPPTPPKKQHKITANIILRAEMLSL